MLNKSLQQISLAKFLQEEAAAIVRSAKASGAEFVLIELKVGLQFAERARRSYQEQGTHACDRQKAEAIKAHRSVLKFLPQSEPTAEQRTLIDRKLAELETAIPDIERLFPSN